MMGIHFKTEKGLSRVVMVLGALLLLGAVYEGAIAAEPTDITGTITARREGAVKVEFKPHPKAAPKVGDHVDFKTKRKGFEMKAGKGEVTEVKSSYVWVKVLKNKPKLKMTGIIHATGLPELKENKMAIKGFQKFDTKDPELTLKILFPPEWKFKYRANAGGRYEFDKEGASVLIEANVFSREKTLTRAHKIFMARQKEINQRFGFMGKAKWEPIWENRPLGDSSDCLADHVLTTNYLGVQRRMWATCVSPQARSSPNGNLKVYKLIFSIFKKAGANMKLNKYWSDPWEDWFVKAVQSFSIETKK